MTRLVAVQLEASPALAQNSDAEERELVGEALRDVR
jgi:hypothetical protein